MNIIKILFIFFLFFFDISCNSLANDILLNLLNYSLDILNSSLFFEKNFSSCFTSIYNAFNKNNPDFISKAFRYSGKGLNDIGDEKECTHFSKRLSYFTLFFRINKYENMASGEDVPVLKFLNQKYFYCGFCLMSDCEYFFKNLFNKEVNEIFLDFLYEKYSLTNISINYTQTNENNEWKNAKVFSSKWFFKLLFYFFIIYIIIKFLAGFFKIVNFSENYEQYYIKKKRKSNQKQKIEKNTIITNNNLNEKDSKMVINNINDISANISSDTYQEEYDLEPNFSLYLKTLKYLDLFDNLKIYSSSHNRYFNSKGFENLILLKIIFLFALISYYVMTVITKLPNRNFLIQSFYENFNFFIIKFSIHAIPSLIFLDSAIFGFKFFNYLKNKKQLNSNMIQLKYFLKFILLTIPKIILFIIIIIFFHIFSNHFEYFIENHSTFNYYMQAIEKNTYCYNNQNIFLNPFKLLYLDFFSEVKTVSNDLFNYYFPSPFFNNCYMIVNIFYNEFICFIIMLILIYLTLIIRKKIFDLIILILFILNFLFTIFFVPNEENYIKKYTIQYVLGQNYSEKFTHLFINYYFFGFIMGIIYFYYNDIKSNNSFVNELFNSNENINKIYVPFFYSYKLNIFFQNLKQNVKLIGIIICTFLIFINSLNFWVIRIFYSNDVNSIDIELNNKVKFVIKTEKNFFIFIFFILNIFILEIKQNTIWNLLKKFYLIYPFERITFSFICLCEPVIYLSFCTLVFTLKITYTNIFYISIAMFSIVTFFSILFTLMIEFPLKILIKNLFFRTNKNVENIKNFSNNITKTQKNSELVASKSSLTSNLVDYNNSI